MTTIILHEPDIRTILPGETLPVTAKNLPYPGSPLAYPGRLYPGVNPAVDRVARIQRRKPVSRIRL